MNKEGGLRINARVTVLPSGDIWWIAFVINVSIWQLINAYIYTHSLIFTAFFHLLIKRVFCVFIFHIYIFYPPLFFKTISLLLKSWKIKENKINAMFIRNIWGIGEDDVMLSCAMYNSLFLIIILYFCCKVYLSLLFYLSLILDIYHLCNDFLCIPLRNHLSKNHLHGDNAYHYDNVHISLHTLFQTYFCHILL